MSHLSFSSASTIQRKKSLMCFCHMCAHQKSWKEFRRKVGHHVQCVISVSVFHYHASTLIKYITFFTGSMWNHPEAARSAATPSFRGPMGVSPLSDGERCDSWRSDDKPCVFVCVDCKGSWWFPFSLAVYTSDVVLAIQRSRMLICLLSAEYLSNNNAIFVLESGVQVRSGSGKCSQFINTVVFPIHPIWHELGLSSFTTRGLSQYLKNILKYKHNIIIWVSLTS